MKKDLISAVFLCEAFYSLSGSEKDYIDKQILKTIYKEWFGYTSFTRMEMVRLGRINLEVLPLLYWLPIPYKYHD